MTEPTLAGPNAEQIEYWNTSAGLRWAMLQARLDAMFAPLTEATLRFASPVAGETVVDIGCGCGATVLELAHRVGPGGHVLGIDVSQPMLDVAARRTEGLSQARLALADASTREFAPDANLLFSRFGVMFFDDPVAAFTNMRAALAPGGRLAMAVWRSMAENPWARVPLEAVQKVLPPMPPSDPEAPGPFALSNPDRVRRILREAGFSGIALTAHDPVITLPGDMREAATFAAQIGPAARALVDAAPQTIEAAKAAIATALAAYQRPEGIVLGGAIWLVEARC